jgi:hypothetical protein
VTETISIFPFAAVTEGRIKKDELRRKKAGEIPALLLLNSYFLILNYP